MDLDQDKIARLTPWLMENIRSEDLDPKDMTDYVVSLITSPGTPEQLFQRCVTELEEFLGPQTQSFVQSLFAQITALSQPAEVPSQAQLQQQQQQSFQKQHQQQQHLQQQQPPVLSGGQEELRRNFRGEYPPSHSGFGSQPFPSQPFQPRFNNNHNNNNHNNSQFQKFPMPPPNAMGMPPQFGFQGFGKPMQGYQNNHQRRNNPNNNNQQQRNKHMSNYSSIHNEISVANKRLIVEKIPEEFLNEAAVKEYFSKFGSVTNVKVIANQQLADVEFEGHDQAVAAHKSPEPIFGNRFVKVFWRKKDDDEPEPELDIEAVRRMQAIKQQQFEEREQKRKDITAQLKVAMAEQVSVLQQRQELLKSGQSTPEQQAQLQQHSEQLSKQTSQLKQELASLSGSGSSGSHSARGGFRGRGTFRGGMRGSGGPMGGRPATSFRSSIAAASLDRRPKNVMLTGVSEASDETLKGELAMRNYTGYSRNSADTVTVAFPDRQTAEEFYNVELPELKDVKRQWVSDAEIMTE